MKKFTITKIAPNGGGRLVQCTMHTGSILAGVRAWAWLASTINADTKQAWAINDEFELPEGSFKLVEREIPNPEDPESTVTITQLVAA